MGHPDLHSQGSGIIVSSVRRQKLVRAGGRKGVVEHFPGMWHGCCTPALCSTRLLERREGLPEAVGAVCACLKGRDVFLSGITTGEVPRPHNNPSLRLFYKQC